jgi:uncharacterized damage-inducible protein DinB
MAQWNALRETYKLRIVKRIKFLGGVIMKIIKMLDYSQYLRHAYFDTFTKLPWEEFVNDRGASFDSIRNIFLHCVEVLDRYVNFRILGNAELPRINFDDYDSIDKVKAYLDQVESDVNEYFAKVTPEELSRKVEIKYNDDTTVLVTVEDILIHLFQEEIHHIGEFIALLWQMKIEPPHLGWARYINM